MTLRSAFIVRLAKAGLTAAALLAGRSPSLASDLIVAVPAGPLTRAITEGFVAPYAQASGAPISVATTDGGIEAARAAHADVLVADGQTLAAGCKDGSLLKLDWPALGGRDQLIAGMSSDCGEGAVLRGVVLAWNRDKLGGQPTWSEFWDVAKVPGKRGLRRGARGNLEIALLADGVAPGDVYSTLRSDAGVERAFRKLDQLKPYLVWWQADDEPPRLLASGEVLMTSAAAEGVVAAARGEAGAPQPGLALQWAGGLIVSNHFAILAGSPNVIAASHFLAYAADPKNQRRLPELGAFGGASTASANGIAAELQAVSPSTPANLQSTLMIDEGFWRDRRQKLDGLFEAWLAK